MDWSILDQLHFLRPQWFAALLPLALLWFLLRRLLARQTGWQGVLASHLYQHLVSQQGAQKAKPPLAMLALAWLLITVALAGPTWERLPQPVYQLHSGKVVVMDMSLSMRATDISPDRLTRARYKAIDLVNAIGEGETGLVAYAGDAFVVSPLSADVQNLTALIPSLTPEIMPVPGSEPFLGVQLAAELLQNAGFAQGEIFIITDGIDNQQTGELGKLIQSLPYRVSVLGVGTAEGAPIKQVNGELLKDNRGAIVVPQLVEDDLSRMARLGGGRYAAMQADDSDIDYLAKQPLLERNSEAEQDEDNFGDQWREMGPYLLLLVLPLAAYSFRRGLLFVLLFGVLPLPSPAQASWWDNLWQTADQQGQQAFNQQQFDQAAEQFNDPLWRGSAAYKNGDYQAALDAFKQADGVDALYNQGNALAKLGELDAAIDAYDKVLAEQPEHADAKANKELLEQLQQQQQNQQDQQNGDGQQDQQQSQDGQNKQEQDNSGEQNQDQGADGESDQSTSESEQNNEQQQSQQQGSEQSSEQDGEQSQQQNQPQQPEQGQELSEEQQQRLQEQLQQEQAQQQDGQDPEQQQAQTLQPSDEPLTDAEREQLQRLDNLLRRVPDDPAFLLKRKMQLENERRQRRRIPSDRQKDW